MQFWTRVLARSRILLLALAALTTPARAVTETSPPAEKPLSAAALAFLELKGIAAEAPAYIRVFKEESELEIWKARAGGRFVHVKTYPICTWSGTLGPKTTQGDHMAPEGFYSIGSGGMKPDSTYHLALNIGYPNALDRALGRSGACMATARALAASP
jgi:murein L,D-transpeptidase YafK